MPETWWRKRLAIVKSRLYLYPAPEPLPRGRLFWLATGLVTLMAVTFAAFYIAYLLSLQNAFQTPAEDVGIMDQAIWSMTHGQLFHQTICNVVSDTNCAGPAGVSRFALHFEPILFPIALLYALWPGPTMLAVLQTLVVASGAFPAFWLARLRLRSNLAGAAIAALYLLYPELQQAEAGFFHPVVLAIAFLMFALYFLYTRRTTWLFVCVILAMACKEEIPLMIALLGLWTIVFQRRWRCGLALTGLALAWLGLALLILHIFSPTGQSLLAPRYSYLGSNAFEIIRTLALHPVALLQQHVFEPVHLFSTRLLFSPVNYLSLLAPWVLILLLPALLLNLFSSKPDMYQGVAQHDAELIPILIFATIEALVLLIWLLTALLKYIQTRSASTSYAGKERLRPASWRKQPGLLWLQPALLFVLLISTLGGLLNHDRFYGIMPYSQGFVWPQVTAHDTLTRHFIDLIPPSASVSAQSSLVPHLSERQYIYMFPYDDQQADYVFLDVTSDNYPYGPLDYRAVARQLLLQGHYGIVASGDGYLLLKRGLPGPGLAPASPATSGSAALPNLPAAFCSFTHIAPQAGTTPVQIDFTPASANGATTPGSLSLLGFQVKRPGDSALQLVTYWKVMQGTLPPLSIYAAILNSANRQVYGSASSMSQFWCPSSSWQPGVIVQMQTDLLSLTGLPGGLSHLGLILLPYGVTSGTISSSNQGLAPRIVQAPATVNAVQGSNFLQLQTFTLS